TQRLPRPSLGRFLAVFAVSAARLAIVAWILPGLSVDGAGAVMLTVGVITVLNGLFWPIVARFATRLIVWTLGIFGLIANGFILLLADKLAPGFHIDSLATAILASFCMTAVATVTGSLMAIDDDVVWRRNLIRRMVNRLEPPEPTEVPDILFLQIDGLSESVLRRALGEGYMPTMARWVRSGTHHVVGWECDLSSQTGASQAGILHGNNTDLPAFRWY
ncbi:MAG: phage holin family protein, partial [Actinomycetia bacterium]|nr:phage holin family protein [Actinomycetes bacterium]